MQKSIYFQSFFSNCNFYLQYAASGSCDCISTFSTKQLHSVNLQRSQVQYYGMNMSTVTALFTGVSFSQQDQN